MSRMLIALSILAAAVVGLAMTARAQQEPTVTESSDAIEPTATETTPSEPPPAGANVEPGMSASPSPSPSPAACEPDRILVKLKPGADPTVVLERHGGTLLDTIPGIDVHIVTVPGGTGQQVIDAMNADPEVEYAEPDGVVRIASEDGDCP